MRDEMLRHIDECIQQCMRKLSFLGAETKIDQMDDLYRRLVNINKHSGVELPETINAVCFAFFNHDEAYVVNKAEWCIDIKREVYGYRGKYNHCTACSISFYRSEGKMANESPRQTEVAFNDNGQWKHEFFSNVSGLVLILCQYLLPNIHEKDAFIAKVISFFE